MIGGQGTPRRNSELPIADVGILVLAAGLAVAAIGIDVEIAVFAGLLVEVGLAPGVRWNGFLEVGALPFGDPGRGRHQGRQALFGRGVATHIEAVGLDRFLEGVDLRARDLDFGFADLREITWRNIARQQADDDHDDQQFEEGEAGVFMLLCVQFALRLVGCCADEPISNYASRAV